MQTIRIIKIMRNSQESVELFHLLFLRHMNEKIEKNLYAVKGGCNLRFFFKSIRYSEDLDIDIKTIAKETLRNKINRLLESKNFQDALATKGIEIEQVFESKQTETTQRWKLSLKLSNSPVPLPTKIEFSRRKLNEDFIFEPVDQTLINYHQLYPILINHYSQDMAFFQKIDALVHRTEVQARDVFDIHLLLDRDIKLEKMPDALIQKLDIAIENALSVDFSEFKSKVVAYLMKEYQDYYNSPLLWSEMQTKVALILEGLQST